MKKFSLLVLLSLFPLCSVADEQLAPFLGKWAMKSYGCNDEDGQGIYLISKEKEKIFISGYELHLIVTSSSPMGDGYVKVLTKSVGDHDGLSNGEKQVVILKKSGGNLSLGFDKKATEWLIYCGKSLTVK
jgi:hypothetical protein